MFPVERKFYKCDHCGNLFLAHQDGQAIPLCCAAPMRMLTPNQDDGMLIPSHWPRIIVNTDENTVHVKVGMIQHPMDANHYIRWLLCIQNNHTLLRYFKPGGKPEMIFPLHEPDATLAAYSYCEPHGLWAAVYGLPEIVVGG